MRFTEKLSEKFKSVDWVGERDSLIALIIAAGVATFLVLNSDERNPTDDVQPSRAIEGQEFEEPAY